MANGLNVPSRRALRENPQVRGEESIPEMSSTGSHCVEDPNNHGMFRSFFEFFLIIIVTLACLSMIRHWVAQRYYVPSGSMESTIMPGDYILASKLVPNTFDVSRGDVVVFNDSGHWLGENQQAETSWWVEMGTWVGVFPDTTHQQLVKRVIGLPGDTVRCCDVNGHLEVNGVSVDEPYLKQGVAPSSTRFEVTVPSGRLWVMGDNRSNSADSRAHQSLSGGGTIPISDVLGKAVAITWPWRRIGWIPSQSHNFNSVSSGSKTSVVHFD